ncbi:MAG: PocR ligand-binding domain-containing protein [Blautia sp.]|nr:PocR ligand-binding domain-containing protein [Lachnoclostridium sp.]MCM1212426.1 PocR ligand-binding domain-containing protein [Blautia sp.]
MDYEMYLTDLIDRNILQRIQDAFARMSGIAALTTDTNGIPVTDGSNFSDFCMKYTRNSPVGCMRCAACDKSGADLAIKNGRPTTYTCHAGLTDFAAPIMANGKMVGCFIGGQVLTKKPDPEEIKRIAKEIGVDPNQYLAAIEKVKILDQEVVDNAAQSLSMIAEVLSDIAYNKYLVYQAKVDLEKTSNMKSDFLANMSHEIRTPMNAVIGMAEMALREELPSTARNYINQIKDAGKSLLTIINDILDFSKIESGKMDINVVDYEPMSVVNDVTNIVMTRLKGKEVELILDISPNLPSKLLGDNIRIKQILLNIANNAAKFTSRGRILLKMDYMNAAPDEIELQVSIEDTGIGIKKEDLDKLFQSFQQVNSKRNRNIEGTGLGLAISKQLLALMDGNIWVESEYEKGSKFSFVLPQKIIDDTPSIGVKNPEDILVTGLISNPYVKERFFQDVERLGVEWKDLDSEAEFAVNYGNKKKFLFVEQSIFSATLEDYVKDHPDLTAVLLIDFFDTVKYDDIPNLLVMKKPLSILNIAIILNGEDPHMDTNGAEMSEFEFIAPEANILIVDDNAVNLTVAEGLLEPLKMQVDTATSGMEAIDKISRYHYDLIFMDHMMPEIDGVETTRIIRRLHPEYNDVPIIALTANAVEGTKEQFCQEGMNDFVAKPIELRILVSKVRQWLPIEKIQKVYMTQSGAPKAENVKSIEVGDLDVTFALKFLGNEELFWTVLKTYYRSIGKKAKLIKSLEEEEDWTGYTIEVHALKSSSKQVGAISLSDKAAALEKAGNARDLTFIRKNTDEMIAQYLEYVDVLKPFFEEESEEESEKEEITVPDLLKYFTQMRIALEDLDMDEIEEIVQEMDQYAYKKDQKELFEGLKEAVEEFDVDGCETILQKWENYLGADL